jgi:hypothetical protein
MDQFIRLFIVSLFPNCSYARDWIRDNCQLHGFFLFSLIAGVTPATLQAHHVSDVQDIRETTTKAIMTGDYQQAISGLEAHIHLLKTDTAYVELQDALCNLYLLENEWEKIYQLYHDHSFAPEEDRTLYTMSGFFRTQPKVRVDAGAGSTLEFKPSISGTPVITAVLNGRKRHFWVDSGAGMTVLSASMARRCGVTRFSGVNATAATGSVLEVGYGIIDSLVMGNVRFAHLPCLVLDDRHLEFRVAGIKVIDIDGIIGWNVLQELAVTVNHQAKQITFGSSAGRVTENCTLSWMGVPLVICRDTMGTPHLFTFDTGAAGSAAYPSFAGAYDTTGTYYEMIRLGSAGGVKEMQALVYPRVVLETGGQRLELQRLPSSPELHAGFLAPRGVLGSDQLNAYILHYDLRGGRFELR